MTSKLSRRSPSPQSCTTTSTPSKCTATATSTIPLTPTPPLFNPIALEVKLGRRLLASEYPDPNINAIRKEFEATIDPDKRLYGALGRNAYGGMFGGEHPDAYRYQEPCVKVIAEIEATVEARVAEMEKSKGVRGKLRMPKKWWGRQ
jgi:hypothetical protein